MLLALLICWMRMETVLICRWQEIVTFNTHTKIVMVNHRENPPQDAAFYTLAECGVWDMHGALYVMHL
jgi:hypothetical protein